MNEENVVEADLEDDAGSIDEFDVAQEYVDNEENVVEADLEDDAGSIDEFDIAQEYVDQYYTTVTVEHTSSDWFDTRLQTLHESVQLSAHHRYRTVPRSYNPSPQSVPAQHPIRAVAKAFHDAPKNSTIRIHAYMLTDPFVIDLLVHHGADKQLFLILDDNEKNTKAQHNFFSKYGTIARDAFTRRVQVQLARHDSTPFFSHYTQMHQKTIITEAFTFFGSYNLSCPARCASWESMVCVESTDSDVADFDKLWSLLVDTKRNHEEKKKRAAIDTARQCTAQGVN
jgi:PLD-like domain